MGEQQTFDINDTHRAIQAVMDDLRAWESPLCELRVKALILTRLEEAQLWSLKLIKKV